MSETSPIPPVASSAISVLLFAHAFATDTSESLQAWRQYLETLVRPYEIFLLQETRPEVAPTQDDPLPDSAGATRIFSYERAQGFRDALNDAIRTSQHPLVVFCAADKQYVPSDLGRMLKLIDKVYLVVGFRAGGQAPPWLVLFDTFVGLLSRLVIGVPAERRLSWLGAEGWGRRWVARWIFGVRAWDPECPYRLARRGIFDHLPIQSSGPFVQVEMLAKANHLLPECREEPVQWTPPELPANDAISFSRDAWLVFRSPDFGVVAPAVQEPAPLPDVGA